MLAWWGAALAGAVAVPINTAHKGEYLRHQLRDSGSRVLIEASLVGRAEPVVPRGRPRPRHRGGRERGAVGRRRRVWLGRRAGRGRDTAPARARPSSLATFVYTGGTTGPSKGCMLSHRYHEVLARQIGICWRRTAEDVV